MFLSKRKQRVIVMNPIAKYIANEFRRRIEIHVSCDDENETIHVRVQNAFYTMTISSDDDEYVFVNDDDANDVIRFPIA